MQKGKESKWPCKLWWRPQGPARTCDASVAFAWGHGEGWDEGEEEVMVPNGRAAGRNGQEKHEGSSRELQPQRGWEPQPLGRSIVEQFELNLLCGLVTGSADPTWIATVWKHPRAVALLGTARAGNAEQSRCRCLSCTAFSQYVFSLHIVLIVYFSSCSSLLQIWQGLLLHNIIIINQQLCLWIRLAFFPITGLPKSQVSVSRRRIKMLGRLVPLYFVIISSLPVHHSSFLGCQLWKQVLNIYCSPGRWAQPVRVQCT